jgi:hypothetical protein
VRFHSIINGYFTILGNATLNAPAIGEVWHLLIQALSDGTLRAKAWRNGESEPASWLLSLTDSTFSSGVLGVEIQRFGTCYYFWIGVGTAGDGAPRPSGANTYNESVSTNDSASAVADLLASFFVVMGEPTYNALRFIRLKETRNATYGETKREIRPPRHR